MSKKLSYIALDHLDTLRLKCKAMLCKGSAVVSLERIGSEGRQILCPECGAVLRHKVEDGEEDAFMKLAQAVAALGRVPRSNPLDVELVLE